MNVLITGATGNLGRAMWDVATEHGARVFPVARHGKGVIQADIEHPLGRARVVAALPSSVDLVVMAHGIQRPAFHEWTSITRAMVENHVFATIGLIEMLHRGARLPDGSLIVLCSSIQATTPRSGRLPYATAKAALEGLGRALAVELAPHTRVVVLRLGQFTKTMRGIHFTPEEAEALGRRALLPWIDPVEIARFIWALYGVQSLTGAVIDYDSGQHLNVW